MSDHLTIMPTPIRKDMYVIRSLLLLHCINYLWPRKVCVVCLPVGTANRQTPSCLACLCSSLKEWCILMNGNKQTFFFQTQKGNRLVITLKVRSFTLKLALSRVGSPIDTVYHISIPTQVTLFGNWTSCRLVGQVQMNPSCGCYANLECVPQFISSKLVI